MRITVTKKNYYDVDIDDQQMLEITLEYLYQKFNWKLGYYIKDNVVYEDVEYYTSHSYDVTEKVRDASFDDIMVYEFLKKLREK